MADQIIDADYWSAVIVGPSSCVQAASILWPVLRELYDTNVGIEEIPC